MYNSKEPDSKKIIIPPAILTLIQKPPLLKGESLQEYNDLLAALVCDIAPTDIPEYLWVLEFADCVWEIRRDLSYRAKLIDWSIDQMSSGYSKEAGPAMSLVRAAPKVEVIDKILDRLRRRSDIILQQLEGRREVFAARARRAAEKALKVQPVPGVVAPPTVPQLPGPINESAQGRSPTDDTTIETVPEPREQALDQTLSQSSDDTRNT